MTSGLQLPAAPAPDTTALLRLPWFLSQRPPLTEFGFRRLAAHRDLIRAQSSLPLTSLGPPMYVLRREPNPDGEIQHTLLEGAVERQPVSRAELLEASSHGRLVDGIRWNPSPRSRVRLREAERPGLVTRPLYAWSQILFASALEVPAVRAAYRCTSPQLRGAKMGFRNLSILLSLAEARYLPDLVATLRSDEGKEAWDRYVREYDPTEPLRLLKTDAATVRAAAELLVTAAGRFDPLRNWLPLVQQVQPDQWQELRGLALVALDHRLAAEILFQLYEDLAERDSLDRLPLPPPRYLLQSVRLAGPAAHIQRLSDHPEDRDWALSEFGLTTRPRMILVVEGQTEEIHVPLVLKKVDQGAQGRLTRAAAEITVLALRGVSTKIDLLVRYAIAPEIRFYGLQGQRTRWPISRLLICVDPEGPYRTREARLAEQSRLREEVRSVLSEQGVEPEEEELEVFADVATWSNFSPAAEGLSYEFAHFSDEELAAAVLAVSTDAPVSVEELLVSLGQHRRHRQNIALAWKRWPRPVSKTALARELWPVLDRRIDDANAAERLYSIPIVALVMGAYVLSTNMPKMPIRLGKPPPSPPPSA